MDTGKDKDSMGERGSSLVWKEPINGKTAFFTEEVYQQMAGPEPSLEDRVMKMMDALGFPPSSKVSASRRSGFPGAQQKSVDNWNGSEGCSQDNFTASAAAPPEVKNENTASTSQPTPESESKEKGGGDSVFKPTETPASPDTPMSPPPHDNALDTKLEHYTVYCEPQGDTSNLAVTSTCTSTLDRDKASASLETEVPDPKQSREHQGQVQDSHLAMEASVHQSWAENNVKDNSINNVGQTRSAAPRAKKHDKARRPPVPEARKSCLTHDQHIRYMFLFKKFSQRFLSGFCNPPTPSEHLELQEFEGLQLQAAREQEECQTYLKQMAQLNPYFYTHLPTHVSQYTKEKEEGGWKRVENYCRYYNTDGHLPLMLDLPQPGPSAPPLPSLTLRHTLLELGSKCKVVMPDLNPNPNTRFKRTVSTELQKISARFPPVYHSSQRAWNHESASKDSNLDSLVQKYSCQIATSASVIHQLINNHAPDFAVAWDIPVVVRQYGNGAASQKVVFLDKPLLPKSRSACEKKIQYLRKAVRAYICQPHNERKSQGNRGTLAGRGRTTKDQEEAVDGRSVAHSRTLNTKTEDDDPFGSVSMEDLETFGSEKMFSKSSRKGADVKGGKGRQRGTNAQAQIPRTGVSEGLGAEMPAPVPRPDVQDEHGSMQTSESTSHKEDVLAGSEPKQETEEKDWQNTAKTNTSSSMNPPDANTKSGPKRSETCEQQEPSSDSDMDALVIADVFSPSPTKPAGSPVKFPQLSPRRSSRNSRNSIFDEVPEFMTSVPDSSLEQAQTSVVPSRRITRSVSQKLQSPDTREEDKRSASVDENIVLDLSQKSTAPSDQVNLTPVESAAIPGASASPRITRQSAKRKLSEPMVSSEPESSSSAVEEPACSSKKGRKVGGQMDDHAATSSAGFDRTEQDTQQGTEEKVGLGENDGSALAKSGSEKETKSEKDHSCAAAPSYLDSLLTEMTPSGNSTKIKLQEDPRQYGQPGSPGDHVGYHLWDLSGMALIVRCNSHAFFRDMRQQEKSVYVMAKPERQVPHGLEQNTLSECVGGWLGCYLRPNSFLLRARVNVQNSEVVHTEELQLNQILPPTLNFSPHHAFAVLRNIFAKLTELPPGSYLLSHEAGANSVMLRCATETRRGSYDLRAQYMGLIMQEVDRSVAWVPVDPTLILPYHWKMGLIPVTFQPADFDPKRKKQQFVAPKKKQRNRKKQN